MQLCVHFVSRNMSIMHMALGPIALRSEGWQPRARMSLVWFLHSNRPRFPQSVLESLPYVKSTVSSVNAVHYHFHGNGDTNINKRCNAPIDITHWRNGINLLREYTRSSRDKMVEYTTNRYKVSQKIGEGVHGVVLKATDLCTGQMVAIKKVSLRTKYGEISLSALREIKTLQNCDCPYVSPLPSLNLIVEVWIISI